MPMRKRTPKPRDPVIGEVEVPMGIGGGSGGDTGEVGEDVRDDAEGDEGEDKSDGAGGLGIAFGGGEERDDRGDDRDEDEYGDEVGLIHSVSFQFFEAGRPHRGRRRRGRRSCRWHSVGGRRVGWV